MNPAMTSSQPSAPPSALWPRPSADAVRQRFVGKPISSLPTPAMLIDRAKMARNCAAMLAVVEQHWDCRFRAHIKTHKTAEATAAMVEHSRDKAIIVSTLAEAWGVVESNLVRNGIVKDILYGFPLGIDKIAGILALCSAAKRANADCDVKVLVDHRDQVSALQAALGELQGNAVATPLNVLIKIDCGYRRAGQSPKSQLLVDIVDQILATPQLSIWGVYCHAGFSYSSESLSQAQSYLSTEMQSANEAAALVNEMLERAGGLSRAHCARRPLCISVGSTPTAHAAISLLDPQQIARIKGDLHGELELHAGNYPFLDLQQLATKAVPGLTGPSIESCSLTVLSTVASVYPGRAANGVAEDKSSRKATVADEGLCDAGGLALSKDTGPIEGYGHVVRPRRLAGWQLGRISQEHGVLTVPRDFDRRLQGSDSMPNANDVPDQLRVGDKIEIIPQHACMVAAAHPWFYIIDTAEQDGPPAVADVWVPWKGW